MRITEWITRTVAGVESLVAPYPFDVHVALYRAEPGDSPVPWANTLRSRRQGVNFHVDPGRTREELLADWTAPHELSHLLIPFLGRRHAWFAEGFASYMQYQVMRSMGIVDDDEIEQRYREKIGEASRRYDLADRPFVEAAGELVARREYPTMYWGGAAYFLQADRRLRERGSSVPDVLREFVECCRTSTRGLEGLVAKLDRIAGTPVFSEQLETLRTQRGFPASIWADVTAAGAANGRRPVWTGVSPDEPVQAIRAPARYPGARQMFATAR